MFTSRALRAVGGAVCAGAVLLATASPAAADEVREKQWALTYLNAEKAWQESTGKGVTVAVIDSGVDATHADLERNTLEGKDFTSSGPANAEDENNHGTSMASLIAGHGHGSGGQNGIKGLAPGAKILPVKDLAGDDFNKAESYAEALRYAVDQGAKVLNLSFSSYSKPDMDEKEAIAYAMEKDVLLVASAGNDGSGNPNYPAASPGVLAVGAVDEKGKVWEDSNYGKHLMLTAPGVNIQMAAVTEPYGHGSGTSSATAYVSGAAALVRSKFPDLTAGQVANRLVKTAAKPADAKGSPDPYYGYGTIRPYEALTADIPAGPKNGPLKTPEGIDDGLAKPDSSDSAAGSGSSEGNMWLLIAAMNIVIVLLLIAGVVWLILRSKRKKREREMQASGGYGHLGGYPPFPGQQQVPPHHGAYPPPPGQGPPPG